MRSNLEDSRLFESLWSTGKWGSTRRILAANIALTKYGPPVQFLDPNGSTINITLPAVDKGRIFFIFNVGASGSLVVKDANGITLASVAAGSGVCVTSSESEWGVLGGGGASGGLNVREVTAAGAVTVDVDTDDHILINKTVGAATTVNLPPAAGRAAGRGIKIVDAKLDANTNNITVDPSGAETILGLSTWVIDFDGGEVTVFPLPNGSGWYT